jgi:SsrA-binding protein
MEAGLELTGTEVKSARAGGVQIAEAYARIEQGPGNGPKCGCTACTSRPYEQGNVFNAEPRRKRKLLLHRDQINRLAGRVQQKGYTLVPLKFYFTRGKAKLELGVGKGRKTVDKRRAISDRETRRDMQKAFGERR